MNRMTPGWIFLLTIAIFAAPAAFAQAAEASPAPVDHGAMMSSEQQGRMHGTMHGRDGTGGMMGMCPMMGGGMGMGMMMGTAVLMTLFWIAAIFALFSLGIFLLRRSRPTAV